MAVTEIGSSFRAKLDLWLSSQLLPSVFICFAGLYYVELLLFFFFLFHCHQSKWLLCCRAVCTCGDLIVRTLLEPLDLLKSNIHPDICGLLTWYFHAFVGSWHRESTALHVPFGAITRIASFSRSTPETTPRHSALWRGHCSPSKVANANLHMLMPFLHSRTERCKWSINQHW